MKKGLILEGGGMRALFTAGILDVMMEERITVDGTVGVSAGATFGCNYKSVQPGRPLRYNLRFMKDPRYMGWRTLLKDGNLVSAEFSYHTMPTELDIFDAETFAANPMEFHVVCTDVYTGKPVYKKLTHVDYDCLEWLRASASMPIVSRPVEVGGYKLLDGGIADSIPLRYFQDLGYERNIVILTQPKGFTKKRTKLMPAFHLFTRRYPAIVKAMGRRHLMYNEQLEYLQQQEEEGRILLIYPPEPLPIGRTEQNEKKMRHVYGLGRRMGLDRLEEIKAFLAAE
ncbi:MAG: patatin family protein [Bacteroidaceae bacterium]|nr:patatin family protein [Bacteroidaceae bacterium]MBR2945140.1 patatin family protein [Bacteroidaceae bacterium]MDO5488802.1 patatin family protein [Bacteroidaceae bacterium]